MLEKRCYKINNRKGEINDCIKKGSLLFDYKLIFRYKKVFAHTILYYTLRFVRTNSETILNKYL